MAAYEANGVPIATTQECVGDCNGDCIVTVDESILGVNISLGLEDLGACARFDGNQSETVTIAELVTGVTHALLGSPEACVPAATPTMTPTPEPPTPTQTSGAPATTTPTEQSTQVPTNTAVTATP